MNFRRTFILIWTVLWLTEPYLALAVPAKPVKQMVCSTCGMKDSCDEVCCCVGAPEGLCHQHVPGLYAAGCTPSDSNSHLLNEDTPKWFSSAGPFLSPKAPSATFFSKPFFIPSPPFQHLTPPPERPFLP